VNAPKKLNDRPLNIPVILGTVRKGRASVLAARFVSEQLGKRKEVATELIDIASLRLPTDDAGEAIKDKDFSEKINGADGLVIVAPEYNHSFPGLLKHVLDSNLPEYIHKAVGIAGVSAGPFGGARMIQNFLSPLRELGLVTIFYDIYFGNVFSLFDESGALLEPAFVQRTEKFLNELVWMAATLRYGREHIALK
jgi:NAD(P)H-dependent FMN reductase